jgi:hypothetical protein
MILYIYSILHQFMDLFVGKKLKAYAVTIVAVTALLSALCVSSSTDLVYGQPTSSTTSGEDRFTAQKTAVSKAGTLPIHQSHQTVKVLPARDDGKVWVGTISWASSKPIELELWHSYNASIGADTEHGQPVTAPYGNGTIAFTLLKPNSGTPLPSGSTNFVGDALSFHTLDGTKFTVAYTVDATARSLNQ